MVSTKLGPAIELLPYQQKFLRDTSRFILLCWSRGARKTFTTTLKIVNSCFDKEAHGQRETWVILSRGDRQAKEAIEEAKRHCRAMLLQVCVETGEFTSSDGKRRYTQHEIRFPCGSRIIALPANPDTARGYTANIYLDEFSIHEHDVEIWRAMLPILRGRFRVIISSTPKGGKTRVFYKLLNDTSDIWSKHIVDVYEAVRQGLPLDIEIERKALNDPDGWAQEYELQWLDELTAWLPFDLITACEHHECIPENYLGGVCTIGIDIARHRHLWVAWVLERWGDRLWTREVSTLSKATFAEQQAEVVRLCNRYRVTRIAADKTGIGEKPVEDLQALYGEELVEGVAFSAQAKYRLATIGKNAFEARTLWIPEDDLDIRSDLYSLRKKTTPMGNFQFDTDSGGSGEGSHADRAWALFLALYAAESAPGAFEFETSGLIASAFC